MAKIVITAALFLAMVAMASAYTTITTTVVEEGSNTGSHEMCERQFMEQQQLQQCQMYLQQARPYGEEESIEMVAKRPTLQDEQLKMQCCNQLENVNEGCRCHAIREMVRGQQGRPGKMAKMAMELPRICKMDPRQCQF